MSRGPAAHRRSRKAARPRTNQIAIAHGATERIAVGQRENDTAISGNGPDQTGMNDQSYRQQQPESGQLGLPRRPEQQGNDQSNYPNFQANQGNGQGGQMRGNNGKLAGNSRTRKAMRRMDSGQGQWQGNNNQGNYPNFQQGGPNRGGNNNQGNYPTSSKAGPIVARQQPGNYPNFQRWRWQLARSPQSVAKANNKAIILTGKVAAATGKAAPINGKVTITRVTIPTSSKVAMAIAGRSIRGKQQQPKQLSLPAGGGGNWQGDPNQAARQQQSGQLPQLPARCGR